MKIGDPMDRSTDHGPQNHKFVSFAVVLVQFSNCLVYFYYFLNLNIWPKCMYLVDRNFKLNAFWPMLFSTFVLFSSFPFGTMTFSAVKLRQFWPLSILASAFVYVDKTVSFLV